MILDELADHDGQTLFALCNRLIMTTAVLDDTCGNLIQIAQHS